MDPSVDQSRPLSRSAIVAHERLLNLANELLEKYNEIEEMLKE